MNLSEELLVNELNHVVIKKVNFETEITPEHYDIYHSHDSWYLLL